MYLALKWLMLLSVGMWAMLCTIDTWARKNNDNLSEPNATPGIYYVLKNLTKPKTFSRKHHAEPLPIVSYFNYLTFCAGALAVTIYNKKKEIFQYMKQKLTDFNFRAVVKSTINYLNKTAFSIRIAIIENITLLWEISKAQYLAFKLPCRLRIRQVENRSKLNNLLLSKLKEVGQERNNLGQLLVAAIQENKNIRLRYQLENLAKNRLMRQVQETQKQIRENRNRYVNFQQLYLVTHQENIFLKGRVTRLTKAKDEAEDRLMVLIKRVYECKDNNLKAYCTSFIVKTKDSLLNSDVNEEIRTYLQNARKPAASTSNVMMSGKKGVDLNMAKSWTNTQIDQVQYYDMVAYAAEEEPKLRGLPGEYVWTVKDKDGIIEKLYEYDYGYNFDNGDTIRRIREYSVYHDKDCLLDFKNCRSTTIINEYPEKDTPSPGIPKSSELEFPATKNFLTGSPIFKNFMRNNRNIVARRAISPSPRLLCS